jgi:glycosyltransferase
MKFDIVTLTYNSESTLQDTFNSIKDQKNVFINHIVLDAQSKDKTHDIIKINKTRRTIFLKKKKSGIYNDLNKALRYCKNDVVGILHSDDTFYSKNTLSIIKKIFIRENVNVIYGDIIYTYKNNNKIIRNWKANKKKYENKNLQSSDYNNLLKRGWMPPHTSLFIKREHLIKIGKYNQIYTISSDYDFIIRVFRHKKSKIFYLPKKIVRMKIGGISNKSIKNLVIKSYEDIKILKKNKIGNFFTIIFKNFSKIKQFF